MALVNALFSPQTFTRVSQTHQSLVCVSGEIKDQGRLLFQVWKRSNTWNREGDAWKTFHRNRGSEPVA